MALTETEIKKAKPREKAYRMSDGGGMYLSVTAWHFRLYTRVGEPQRYVADRGFSGNKN